MGNIYSTLEGYNCVGYKCWLRPSPFHLQHGVPSLKHFRMSSFDNVYLTVNISGCRVCCMCRFNLSVVSVVEPGIATDGIACLYNRILITGQEIEYKGTENAVHANISVHFQQHYIVCHGSLECQSFPVSMFSYSVLVQVHPDVQLTTPDTRHQTLDTRYQAGLYCGNRIAAHCGCTSECKCR